MYKVLIFAAGTILLGIISRGSLNRTRLHGFYRFFAWKILLLMFVLNMGMWFKDPITWHHLISWILLIISIVLVILGLRLLRQAGENDAGRKDAELLGWKKRPGW